jgi:hypothetical protein
MGGGRKSKSKSKSRSKPKTKAQKMATARREAGKTISQVKSANKKSMQDKARERHKKFKQTRVQTFGGKKTNFSDAEKTRIEKAGYKVEGYSKAPAQSDTQLQVNKDIQMYGNTFPSGAIGISEEGKAQAAANRAEAAAKRTVPAGSFNISAAGRKQAEANKAAAAAKAQAEAKRAAESRRLSAENARRIAAERAAAKAEADRVAAAKKAAEKAAAERARVEAARKAEAKRQVQFDPSRLSGFDINSYAASLPAGVRNDMNIGGQTRSPLSEAAIAAGALFGGKALLGGGLTIGGAATKGLGYKGTQVGFTGMGKTGFDAIRGGAKYIPSSKPQILGKGAYSAPTLKGAQRYAGATGSLGGAQTPGGVIKSIVPGKASRIGFIESQAKVPGATFDKGAQLANRLSAGNYASSPLANRLRSQMVSGVAPGGGIGSNLGNIAGKTGVTTAVAGGLNIGSTGGIDSGEASSNTGRSLTSRALGAVDAVVGTDLDKLGGRTTPFGERLTESIGAFGTLNQNISDLSGQSTGPINTAKNLAKSLAVGGKDLSMEDMAASTSFAKAFKDKPLDAVANLNPDGSRRVIKTLKTLDKNKDVSEALANYGGKGFQTGLRDTASLVSDNYDKLSTDAKGNRKVVSDMLMGNDPRAEFGKRLAFQQKENPQLSMQSKIKYASDPNFKQYTGTDRQGNKVFENKIKGINRKEMGIVGGLGNFVLSNQGRDIVTGNLPGTNNALDLASNIINTGRDPSSSTYKASQGFLKTIGAGGQPTPGSIIRGVNPFRGGGGGGGTTTAPRFQSVGGGGGAATPTATATPVPQFQVPEFPIQQGTDAGNLANIQNESYQNTFRNLMAINPNYSARFQMRRRRGGRRGSFRTAFSRRFFS